MSRPAPVIAVDIGGSKIAVAAVTWPATITARLVRPTPPEGGAAVLREAAAMVTELAAGQDRVAGVGVGCPGVIEDGSVSSATATLPAWAGQRVRAELARRTGLPVAVENDVHAMARGELSHGAARGLRDVVFVSVGTGVGGALARDGRIVAGAHGMAGELGHLLVPGLGAIPCGCGRRDHLEARVSGPAIAASCAGPAFGGPASFSLPDAARRAREGDAVARGAIEAAASLLGRALAGLLAAVDPEAVVLGGGVIQLGALFLTPVTEALRAEALPPLRRLPVLAARLGTDAPLVGAAQLARQSAAADQADTGGTADTADAGARA